MSTGNLLIRLEHDGSGDIETLTGSGEMSGVTVLAEGTDLGTPTENPQYSRTITSYGVQVTGATKEAREQALSLLVEGDTLSDLQSSLDRIAVIVEKIGRKGGGTLHYRSVAGTKVTRFRIAHAKISDLGKINEYESFYRQRITISFLVDPLGLTNPLDFTDKFLTDTLGTGGKFNIGGADWTKIGGSASLSVSSAKLLSTTTASDTIYSHTGIGNNYNDIQLTAKFNIGATLSNGKYAGVAFKCFGVATNFIGVIAQSTGAGAGTLQVFGVSGGAPIAGATTAITTLSANTDYWVRGRMVGNVIIAEWFTSEPTPLMTPIHTTSYTLTTAEQANVGKSVLGPVGIVFNPNGSTLTIDDFDARAFCYSYTTFPRVVTLNGEFGGTGDARAAVSLTTSTLAYSETVPHSMLLAWWPKPEPYNMVLNHSGELGSGDATAYGWSASAVTGVMTNAGSLLQRAVESGALNAFGKEFIQVTSNAAGNSGAAMPIYTKGGFKKGVTYTAECEVKTSAGTNSARIGLGANGNISHGTSSALSSSWAIRTVTWTPTADVDIAYVTPQVTTASATVLQFRRVQVYEGTTAPRLLAGGYGPGIIPAVAVDPANTGSGFAQSADANYLIGLEHSKSGQLATNLDYFILPHLFAQDDYTSDEIDLAVFARCEVQSTQPSLKATISVVGMDGNTYAANRYSEFYADGKVLNLPNGTRFKPYYLGTVTVKINRANPRRARLSIRLDSSISAAGLFGLDYLVVVPAKNVACSMTGVLKASVNGFIRNTAEATKIVNYDLSTVGGKESNIHTTDFLEPDQSLLLNQMIIENELTDFLIWPSSQVIDAADAASTDSMTIGNTITAQISIQPQVHLLDQ